MDPWAGIVFGESDMGKTLMMIALLEGAKPGETAYLAGRGGLSTGTQALRLPSIEKRTFVHNRPTLAWGVRSIPKLAARGVKRLGIDDATIMAGNTLDDLTADPAYTKVADRYLELERQVRALGNVLRASEMISLVGTHVREGRTDRAGMWHPGGPDFKGNKVMKVIPRAFDFCAMVRKPGTDGHPAAQLLHAEFYVPGPADEDWVTKDRYDVFHRGRRSGPANLREYMRAAGIVLTRPPGLEWQDQAAAAVAKRVRDGEGPRDAWAWLAGRLRGKFDMRHVRWAAEDGLARAVFSDPELSDPMYLPPEGTAATSAGSVTDLEGDVSPSSAATTDSGGLE